MVGGVPTVDVRVLVSVVPLIKPFIVPWVTALEVFRVILPVLAVFVALTCMPDIVKASVLFVPELE